MKIDTKMKQNIITKGAEAIISLKNNQITKKRIQKSYRLPQIDEQIRKLRTRSEGKILEKAGKIVSTPKIFNVNEKNKEILMEFIDGKKLSNNLDKFHLKEQKEICKEIGKSTAKLHNAGIIHGDLTTSNMIYVSKEKNKLKANLKLDKTHREAVITLTNPKSKFNFQIFFIDFGLSFHSQKYEDKAVDIHLIKQALEAKHFKNWKTLYKEFLNGYSKESKEEKIILKQLEKVERRGRYKEH